MKRASLVALLLHSLLIQVIAFLVRPAVSYAALDLGAPAVSVGAIGAAFALVPLLLALVVGRLVDRRGERVALLGGSALAIVACVALALWGHAIVGLLVGTALLGAGHLGCIVGQQAVVARSASAGGLDSLFGYYTFAASLGQAIGPLLLTLGGDGVRPDTRLLFIIGGVLALVLMPTTFAIERRSLANSGLDAHGGVSAWMLLRSPGVARAIATSAIVVAAVDLTVVYVPALGAELGLSAAAVGAVLAARAVASMASRLLLGMLARRLGRGRLMVTSLIVSSIGLIALAAPLPFWALVAIAVVLGLGLGVGQPLTMSWLVEQAPEGQRGRALALRLSGNRLSQLAIPAAAGALAGFGAGTSLAAVGVLVAASLLLMRGLRLDGDQQSS
ncbi:MFS transporter [Agrococcus terreus]|uniref:Major facilitator superfamily (MFS) profile domain-containing protein n=1 Tax=Agrococcus terreus TaxID=574649 RepID=A0ABQ2KJN4_9MICO|nr:MFS transporter [Agrococcus terreus]GGN84954.1 hypothetical protein GCM10010968_17280 [Agrococcus terreus]